MNSKQTPGTPRTVRVRIAVAVDHTGAWAAGGMSEYAPDDERNKDCAFIENLHDSEVFHWIEADVPVPVKDHATVVQGEVSKT